MDQGEFISESVQWIVIRLASLMSVEETAMYANISTTSVRQIVAHFKETGDVIKSAHSEQQIVPSICGPVIGFTHHVRGPLPDIYLDELRLELKEVCGVLLSLSTIWKELPENGYSIKKLSRGALERSAEARADYARRISQYSPDQLVYVDESALNRLITYRGEAWAVRGGRATRKVFVCQKQRFSVLPALSMDGVLHCDVIEGAFDSDTFYTFMERLLDQMRPYPAPNSVIVMDNSRVHRSDAILNLIESCGMRYEFLPPYSHDFNPVELLLSAMKYRLRCSGDYARLNTTHPTFEEIYYTLLLALYQVTPEDMFGWQRYYGYI